MLTKYGKESWQRSSIFLNLLSESRDLNIQERARFREVSKKLEQQGSLYEIKARQRWRDMILLEGDRNIALLSSGG